MISWTHYECPRATFAGVALPALAVEAQDLAMTRWLSCAGMRRGGV